MRLTVLNVAYPLAPVGRASVGGAEQILAALDAALVRGGNHSIVLACGGSAVAGTLWPLPQANGLLDEAAVTSARERHDRAIQEALRRWPIDVIHMHGVDFHHYLPHTAVPVLATLHLPIDWYPAHALRPNRPNTWFNCVSTSQHRHASPSLNLLPPIENGVALEPLTRHAKRGFALMLGRVCPEKGVHIAIDAAKRAGVTLLIGGEIFEYEAHRRYFDEEVRPRLDARRRFLGPVGLDRKRRLLAAARCLLIPSLAEETSSLVAREALAAGTPVVAFDRGALRETIEHGRTGYLVRDAAEMGEAIARVEAIDPDTCRAVARQRFSSDRMIEQYLAVYHRLAASARSSDNSSPVVSAA